MEFTTLSADTAHRFRAVGSLLQQHGRQIEVAAPRLLDVGGYPGTFARGFREAAPRWRATTLDVTEDNLPDYVCAPGTRIPFPDEAFQAVTSIDCFEHIPPQDRQSFVEELCRASSDLVILAAPFHHPATAAVERVLVQAHESVFGAPHPWLADHVAKGLPRIPDVMSRWPISHPIIDIVPSFDLRSWTTWQALSLIHKLRGDTETAWRAFDQAWATMETPAGNPVPYRWIIVAKRGGLAKNFPAGLIPDDTVGSEAIEQARFYARMLELMAADARTAAATTGPIMLEERLKEAMVALERENQRLRNGGGLANGPPTPSSASKLNKVGDILRRFGR